MFDSLDVFLSTPGLLPYAVLSQAANKEEVLSQVVEQLERIEDRRDRDNLTAATSILAGLQLREQTIERLMRSPGMQESTLKYWHFRSIVNYHLESVDVPIQFVRACRSPFLV